MDWSFLDKIKLLSLFVFFKFWRIILPAIIIGLVGLGYFLGQ